MKVVVPHTAGGLHDRTLRAVSGEPNIEFVLLDDDEAYWRLWRELWAAAEDVIVVEQDIVPNPDSFQQFEECRELWCAHAYPYSVFGLYAGTGCVRLRAELLASTPGLIDRVGLRSDDLHPAKHWCRLDAWMQNELHAAGHRMHRHEPAATHLDPGNSHGCVPTLNPE